MTVQQLIKVLQLLPPDAPVVYPDMGYGGNMEVRTAVLQADQAGTWVELMHEGNEDE